MPYFFDVRLGVWQDEHWPDNWTAVTQVGGLSHCEHVFATALLALLHYVNF